MVVNVWYIVFLLLAFLILLSALGVLFFRNPVYSALSLLANLCVTAVMYLTLMGAPFIAMIQIIVYAGAIVVFFLFVLMLMNLRKGEYEDRLVPWRALLGLGVGAVFAIQTFLLTGEWKGWVPSGSQGANVKAISHLIFTRYILAFELVSVLIFVAALGAVALAKKKL
jgi:NADH-quinone oxidoreductase subunit J